MVGWTLVVAGIAALVLPGPGLLMLFGGLAVLSQQYEWAERRLDADQVPRAQGRGRGRRDLAADLAVGAGRLVLIAAGCSGSGARRPPSGGRSDGWWLPGGVATAITQIGSGLIALALIVYSYRRFHGNPRPSPSSRRRSRRRTTSAHWRRDD